MKVNEFIERVNKKAHVEVVGVGKVIQIYTISACIDGNSWFLEIHPKATDLEAYYDWSYANGLAPTDMFCILGLVEELRKTPIEQRLDKPKYWVRFSGLNSDNGPQYLTTEGVRRNKIGKVFACAENHSLKQTFTKDELKDLANRARDSGNAWLAIYILNELHWREANGNE